MALAEFRPCTVSGMPPLDGWVQRALRQMDRKDVTTVGAFEEVKGKVKQAAGDLTDDDQLRREGKAQERKGEAEEEAAAAQAKARAAQTEAVGHEIEQEDAQHSQ